MRTMMPITLVFAIFLLLLAVTVESRGIWGSKRKREEVERQAQEVQEEEIDIGGFEASRRRFESNGGDLSSKLASNMPSKEVITTAINAYIEIMEKMVDAPEFDQLVTSESIRGLLSQVPGLDAYPEIASMLDSEQFQDPAVMKHTILEGAKALREGAPQLAELLSDPAQISMLLEQLPAEVRDVINTVLSGDMSAMKDIINQIPGLADSQKQLLSSMMDGSANPEKMLDSVNEILSDPSQVEAARQQMLSNPGMAEMLGVSKDVLEDPVEFAKLISQGMDAMATGGNSAEAQIKDEELDRKFSASMAA